MSTESWPERWALPDRFRPILKRSAEMGAAARAAVAQVTGLGIESLYLGGLPKPSLKVDTAPLESYVAPRGTVARLIAERDVARADTACLRAALDAMTQERDASAAALAEMRANGMVSAILHKYGLGDRNLSMYKLNP